MEMLLIALAGLLLGGGSGTLLTRRFWPKTIELPAVAPRYVKKRFNVVFATDSGSEARQFYEKVNATKTATIDFMDGEVNRGVKKLVEEAG